MKTIKVTSLSDLKQILSELESEQPFAASITIEDNKNEDDEKQKRFDSEVSLFGETTSKAIKKAFPDGVDQCVLCASAIRFINQIVNDDEISPQLRKHLIVAIAEISEEALKDMKEE